MKSRNVASSLILALMVADVGLVLRVHAGGQQRLYERLDAIASTLRRGDQTHAKEQAMELAKSIDDFNDLMSLQEGGLRLAAAINAMNGEEIRTQAAKTNKACNACHERFR